MRTSIKPISRILAVAMARSKHLQAQNAANYRKRRKAKQQNEGDAEAGEPSRRRRRLAGAEAPEQLLSGTVGGVAESEGGDEAGPSRKRQRLAGAVGTGQPFPETDRGMEDGVADEHSGQAMEASGAEAGQGTSASADGELPCGSATTTQEGPSAGTGERNLLCLWKTLIFLRLT